MASVAYEKALANSRRNLWIVWGAMASAIPLFGTLAYLVTDGDVPMQLPKDFQYAFVGVTGLLGVLGVVTPRLLLPRQQIIEHLRAKGRGGRTTGSIVIDGQRMALEGREERLVSLQGLYLRPFMFGTGFAAGIAMLGMFYVLISAQQLSFLGFAAFSIGVLLVNRPDLEGLIKRSKKYVPEERAPPPTAWPT